MKELTADEQIKKNLNRAKYGWTKWGGPNQGLVQKTVTPFWYCQACREEGTEGMAIYYFEYPEREYVRICALCHYLRLKHNIQPGQYAKLLQTVRLTPT